MPSCAYLQRKPRLVLFQQLLVGAPSNLGFWIVELHGISHARKVDVRTHGFGLKIDALFVCLLRCFDFVSLRCMPGLSGTQPVPCVS